MKKVCLDRMESGGTTMLITGFLVLIIHDGFNVECRFNADMNVTLQNRENITEEIKNKIDRLLDHKLEVYLDLFFNEDVPFNKIERLKVENEKHKADSIGLPRRSKRVRRNANNSSTGYSEWSKFGPCSKSCGGGIRQRNRNCTTPAPPNGNGCMAFGPQTETKLCNIFPCLAERYRVKNFRPLSNIQIDGSVSVKFFGIGNNHFMAALFDTNIQLFKWNETADNFVQHGSKIEVYKAKAFDIFSNTLGTFLVLSEEFKLPHMNPLVSRVLTFNDASGQFEYKNNFFVPTTGAIKVTPISVLGEMHVAFMFHHSHATNGHKFETTVCDRHTKTIKCGPAGRIRIESAFYGRKSWSTCSHGWYFNLRLCSAEGVLQKIATLCNDKTECVIKPPPDGVPDPCPIFTKYLTVVHTCEAKVYKTSLQVYSVKRNHFVALASEHLETHGAKDIIAFTIHHKSFIAIANYKNDAQTLHLDSEIFIYNGATMRFEQFQKIRTDGALDLEFFSIGEGLATEYFLAVANNARYDKAGKLNYETDSVIYKWNWNLFVPFQCIRTTAALKWTAISGENGRFLLSLSSGNSNITTFVYDGWRFYRHELQPNDPAFREHGSLTYSVNIGRRTLFAIASKSKMSTGVKNIFEVEFEQEDSRFLLINKSLSAIHSVNNSLTNLSNVLGFLSKKIVLLNGTNEITGHKIFEKVTVIGDVRADTVEIGNAKLSQEDISLIERQEAFERRLNGSGAELDRLLQRSEKLFSKTKNQTVYAVCDFKGRAKVDRFIAKNIVVADKKVNGIDLNHMDLNALYINQDHRIFGNKTFSSNVLVKNNLIVKQHINGVDTSDLVLLESDQMVYGRKTFQWSLFLDGTRDQGKNFQIRGLVNSVNISKDKLLTVKDDQIVTGDYRFVETLNVEKHLTAKLVNGVNLSNIYEDAVLLDTAQNIIGFKQFHFDVKIAGNLKCSDGITIDGVDVSELSKNILSRTKDQNISNSIELNSNVTFQSLLDVDGLINGINISRDVVYLSREQFIPGEKTFTQNLACTKNLEIDGMLNGLNITGDLLTKSGEQIISGHKRFGNDVIVKGNIDMIQSKEVDGIDLSRLQSQALFKDQAQIVSGEKHFDDLVIQDLVLSSNVSCYLQQLLKNLTESTLKVNGAASIKGTTVIENNLLLSGKLTVKGFLNGIKVPSELVFKNSPSVIQGKKTFTQSVEINGKVELDSTMNGLNVSEMYQKALRLVGSQNLTGKLTFTDILNFESNLRVNGLVNGLKVPEDLVKLDGDEVISAHKVFNGRVEIEKLSVEKMITDGLVDGVDIRDLNRTVLRTDGEQIISGNIVFRDGLEVDGDLQTSGEINGVNLAVVNANAMRINGDQIITGKKIFSAPIAVTKSLGVSGLIDGVNVTELSQNMVWLSGNQTLKGKISFISDLKMNGNLEVVGLVNKINVSKLSEDALYRTGNQTVIGRFRFGDVHVFGNVGLDGKLNGIDLSEDVVKLSANEEMKEKLFKDDIKVKGNLFVSGLIDNVNLTNLNEDCVRLSGLQIIDSKKTFTEDLWIMGNMTIDGLLGGIDVRKLRSSVLDRNRNQTVNGSFHFEKDVIFQEQSTIEGYVNDVNVSEFKKNVVTLSTNQTIEGEKIFTTMAVKDDLILDNLEVVGKVNEKDLSDLSKKIVRVSGMFWIYGSKRFADNVTFTKNVLASGKINGLRIPQDVCLLSRNQPIRGRKTFQGNILIRGNMSVNDGTKVDGVDVSLLAKDAVHLNETQTILYPIGFTRTLKLYGGVLVDGVINGVNLTKENLLLRNGQQTVTGDKTFNHVSVHGDLKLGGKMNGVDLLEMNRSSVFVNRDNFVRAEKEIIGNLLLKGNISITGNVNGMHDFKGKFISAKSYINRKIGQLATEITKQEEAVALYTDAIRSLKPRLDYFIEYQTMKVDENVISFDVRESDDNHAILITAVRRSSRSSIYKAQQPSLRFNSFGELPFSNASDVRLFESSGRIYAALSILQATPSSKDFSGIFELGAKEYKNFTKTFSQSTRRAVNTDVSHYRNNTIITFTNTQNQSEAAQGCVATTPLLLRADGHVKELTTISGCNVVKIITKQINENEILVVSINMVMYGGTDAVVYKMTVNGTCTMLQTIPTNYASDVMFLEVGSTLFLVVANQYQMSEYSIAIEYSVPAQIYHYWKEGNEFLWYQDLDTKGAHLMSSFTIDNYIYLVISSRLEELKIFQFFGSGKFRQVSFIRIKGMTNIKALRTWRINDEVFIGLLSSDFNEINVLKAVKSSLLSGAQIKKMLDEA